MRRPRSLRNPHGRPHQRPDRRRLRRARRPLRARRRGLLPRHRLPQRRQGRPRGLRVGDRPDPRGARDRAAGHRQDARGEAARARRDGRHPRRPEAARQVPDRADLGHAPARLRPQARAPALRRARRRLARRAARGAPRRARSAGCAASAPRSRRASSRRSPTTRTAAGRRRACCSRARSRSPSRSLGALRAHPASDRVEVAGSLRRLADSVKDLDIIATASDPKALARTLGELELVESVQQSGDAGARVTTAHRHEGGPQGRRARPVRQRAAALHGLQGAQRGAARVRRAARACTSPSTGSSTTRRARRCAARPRRRSTSSSGWRGSRPSCARAAASWRPRCRGGGLPELIDARGPQGRPALPHDRLRRHARPPRRWRSRRASAGCEYIAITDHSASHGFGNDVSPERAGARGSRRSASSTSASRGSSC